MRPALPISVRLALWYALTLLLLLGAFATFSYAAFSSAVHRSFDRHLEHELHTVEALVRPTPGGADVEALASTDAVALRQRGVSGTYVRVADAAGRVLYASPNFDGQPPLPLLPPPEQRMESGVSRVWAGGPARSLAAPLGGGTYVEVTGYEWSRHGELRELARMLVLGIVAGVLIALAAGYALARRALRPVAVLTGAAAELAARGGAPSSRLPAAFGPRDELTALAETFNALLGRLEQSLERERRFTADAAHELMTPVTTLRSEAEVALRRERDPVAYREALARMRDEAAQMGATVQGLLQMARAEALARTAEAETDLSDLVAQRVERLRPQAGARGLTLETALAPGIRVAAEMAPLAEVVDNLLANAVKYTPSGGRVTVRLAHDDGTPARRCTGAARLTVEDTGIGFDAATGALLFDRFFRADAPTVQAEPGTGLGLAIVRAVVEGYGGAVAAHSDGPGRGARFTVTLPCLGNYQTGS
ncbi:MAG: sensor histidine kinase [Rubricoccaceae bacterium]